MRWNSVRTCSCFAYGDQPWTKSNATPSNPTPANAAARCSSGKTVKPFVASTTSRTDCTPRIRSSIPVTPASPTSWIPSSSSRYCGKPTKPGARSACCTIRTRSTAPTFPKRTGPAPWLGTSPRTRMPPISSSRSWAGSSRIASRWSGIPSGESQWPPIWRSRAPLLLGPVRQIVELCRHTRVGIEGKVKGTHRIALPHHGLAVQISDHPIRFAADAEPSPFALGDGGWSLVHHFHRIVGLAVQRHARGARLDLQEVAWAVAGAAARKARSRGTEKDPDGDFSRGGGDPCRVLHRQNRRVFAPAHQDLCPRGRGRRIHDRPLTEPRVEAVRRLVKGVMFEVEPLHARLAGKERRGRADEAARSKGAGCQRGQQRGDPQPKHSRAPPPPPFPPHPR